MTDVALTREKMEAVLSAIITLIDVQGYVPSYEEIARMVGYKSVSTVHYWVERLEVAGWIEREPRQPRSIQVRKIL